MTARGGWAWLVGALSAASIVVTALWVRPSGALSALLPDEGDARAFVRRERLFGASEPDLLLLEGADPREVERAARTAAATAPGAVSGLEAPPDAPPTAWMLLARGERLGALERALSPDGMRARLRETRALLLAPGGGAMAEALRRDPLRLAELVTARARAGPALGSDDGEARIVLYPSDADVLDGAGAARARRSLLLAAEAVRREHPGVTARAAGPHVVAAETEELIRRDVAASSALSLAAAALVFSLVSRNLRLIATVVPPVLAGTAMTAALAPLLGGRVSGVAAAFVAVVVGVGMDTGVHAHLAVVDAIRAGSRDPAGRAISHVARPTLTAAVTASAAFACLGAARVPALRQLGLLAAAGELTTALAVLAWTPGLAAWLERRRAASPPLSPTPPTRGSRLALALVACGVATALALGVGPRLGGPVVALVTPDLEVTRTYARVATLLRHPAAPPEHLLLSARDPDALAARVERLADALEAEGASVDVPVDPAVLARRRAARATLGLDARAPELEIALREAGFDPARFGPALADLGAPAALPPSLGLPTRGFARDGLDVVGALRVDAPPPWLRERARAIDPGVEFSGVGAVERTLREALGRELGRLLPLSALVVFAALAIAIRRARVVAVALGAACLSLALTWVSLGALRVPLHVYDALVLPVLVGLTLDETLFLEDAHRRGELARELPRAATTALTTAAGFGALLVCRFPGLRDVGWTGLIGSVAGLIASTLVVCSATRSASQDR
ncbi:MAG: MMPL family transporter [Polyangiaceae bacterium]|nr:MMPL family transporter [Polyangiaceae bacterium]